MAGQVGEGFGGLLLVGGLVFALLYWKIVLSLLLVVGLGAGLITLAQALRMARLRGIASNLGFAVFLEGQGITMVNNLAVEAKATHAAIT